MDIPRLLSDLRDGLPVDLAAFVQGLADGSVSDAQAGAFAMAVCCRGTDLAALTLAMRDSGPVMAWDLPGPVLDKHSTGGVGDPVSLLLAPALAACGAYVPMISGRGLGHTGGTLDKLEAIPGVKVEIDTDRLRRQIEQTRCAIVAASADIAPADRRLYAIRDLTGTIESPALITASILSKKLAAGLEGLVLDVKAGSGAFMKTVKEAEALARILVETANAAGCPTRAIVTDMDQPLAMAMGNALEVAEVMETLTATSINHGLWDVTCALGGEALAIGGLAPDAETGEGLIAAALESGRAAEYFARMVAMQGGPADFVDRWPDRLPSARIVAEVPSPRAGHVGRIDGQALGLAVLRLGAGRTQAGQRINPSVGLSEIAGLGTVVDKDEPLGFVHAASEDAAAAAVLAIQNAYVIRDTEPLDLPPLIHTRLG